MKDKLFEKLYREFVDDLEGIVMFYTNNPTGYKKYYKERLHKLCIDYTSQKNSTEDQLIDSYDIILSEVHKRDT